MSKPEFRWYEFFAGGGMARLGLGSRWQCVVANEWCEKKAAAYRARFGAAQELMVRDINELKTSDLPGRADLAWGSFPCQDLSLAGNGAGLRGHRSGTFRPFWSLIDALVRERRGPRIVVLENVAGALTSHEGKDFAVIVRAFAESGYKIGCLVIDAVRFVPQSRPRLFVIGISADTLPPKTLISAAPANPWHPRSLRTARERLPRDLDESWIWWRLPSPSEPARGLFSIVEDEPTGVDWHTASETKYLLSLMSPLHRKKVDAARRARTRIIGTIYKRTRPDNDGEKNQRAEVRFDNV